MAEEETGKFALVKEKRKTLKQEDKIINFKYLDYHITILHSTSIVPSCYSSNTILIFKSNSRRI